jgi:hypothetical protein
MLRTGLVRFPSPAPEALPRLSVIILKNPTKTSSQPGRFMTKISYVLTKSINVLKNLPDDFCHLTFLNQ